MKNKETPFCEPAQRTESYVTGEQKGVDAVIRSIARLQLDSGGEGARQSTLIRILNHTTLGQSACDTSDFDAHGLDKTRDIHCGCFAFDVGIGCENNFFNAVKTREQFFDANIVRADMLHGRNHSAQNVIYALEVFDFFKRDDIFRFFDDANRGRFASCADIANLVFGVVSAYFAEMHVLFDLANSVDEFVDFFFGRIENCVRITCRRFFADGRKF